MPKVVLKSCYEGYKLSKAALDYLGISREEAYLFEDDPTNPKLVECVEKLGDAANTTYERLRVVEVPDDVEWVITQHYGIEQVEEVHRVWS